MNQVLEEILKSGFVQSTDGDLIKLDSNVTLEEGNFLSEIIAQIKPKGTLEIGLANGISALFICEAIKKIPHRHHHIIVDPNQNSEWRGSGLCSLRRAGFEKIIKFFEEPSQTVLPYLETMGVKVDFAFVDGWHTFDHTLVDFFYIDKLLNVGGVVVFDDSNWPSIRKVIKFILKNRSYDIYSFLRNNELQYYPTSSTLSEMFRKLKFVLRNVNCFGLQVSSCVAVRKNGEDDRRWDYHRNF